MYDDFDPTLWQRIYCVLHGGHFWLRLIPTRINDRRAFCSSCGHRNYR